MAIAIAAIVWNNNKKKAVSGQPPLVTYDKEPEFESLLPDKMEWDAVGSHLNKDSIDYDDVYQRLQREKTIKSLADESKLLYGKKDSGDDDDSITKHAIWSHTRRYTKKEWDEEQARGRAVEEEYDLEPYMEQEKKDREQHSSGGYATVPPRKNCGGMWSYGKEINLATLIAPHKSSCNDPYCKGAK